MTKLKPCKVCGGEGIHTEETSHAITYYSIHCDDCWNEEIGCNFQEDAIQRWNERYHPTCETCKDWGVFDNCQTFCKRYYGTKRANQYCSEHSESEDDNDNNDQIIDFSECEDDTHPVPEKMVFRAPKAGRYILKYYDGTPEKSYDLKANEHLEFDHTKEYSLFMVPKGS